MGSFFIPFPDDHNNKLVQFFQKEKKDKEIYEASGCHGQQTPPFPSTDFSMEDSSDIFCSGDIKDEEDVTPMLNCKYESHYVWLIFLKASSRGLSYLYLENANMI